MCHGVYKPKQRYEKDQQNTPTKKLKPRRCVRNRFYYDDGEDPQS